MKRFKVVTRYFGNISGKIAGAGLAVAVVAAEGVASATPTYTPLIDMTSVVTDVKAALLGPVGGFLALGIGIWLVRLIARFGKSMCKPSGI